MERAHCFSFLTRRPHNNFARNNPVVSHMKADSVLALVAIVRVAGTEYAHIEHKGQWLYGHGDCAFVVLPAVATTERGSTARLAVTKGSRTEHCSK